MLVNIKENNMHPSCIRPFQKTENVGCISEHQDSSVASSVISQLHNSVFTNCVFNPLYSIANHSSPPLMIQMACGRCEKPSMEK